MCKCGKANNPTRKFCVRCGANLLTPVDEEQPVEEVAAPTEADTTPPAAVAETAPIASPDDSSVERTVRPSEVDHDRMRSTTTTVKSELEKAKEAFAKAEEAGIAEGPGDIVETRMLRASEVRELLDKAAGFEEVAETHDHVADPGATPSPGSSEPAVPAVPSSKSIEESILGSKSTLVEHDEPTVEPGPPVESYVEPSVQPEPAAAPPPEPAVPQAPVESVPEPAMEPAAPTSAPEPAAEVVSTEAAPAVVPEVSEIEMKILDADYLDDGRISGSLTDLRHLFTELKQVKSELEEVRAQQEEVVQNYRNDSEVKRIRYEGLREQTLAAKDVWKDAEKEHELADKRRKKELSTRQKRVEKIESGIKKAKSTIDKRVRDLDKAKEKRAQEEKK
jgi:hypothetical protein